MTNFWDVLASPFHAAESVVNNLIGLPKSIVHDMTTAGASVVHDAVSIPKTALHEGAQLGSNVSHDLGSTVQGLGKSVDHAIDATTKNLILPLSIGAAALAFFMIQKSGK